MRRSIAVLAGTAALMTVCGCSGRTPDADGPARSPADAGRTAPASAPARTTTDDRPSAPATRAPATSAPPPAVLWSRGDEGRDVRELQARLRQVSWLFEGPTGTYGEGTERAVKGFQGRRGLPATGRTDTVTWRRLLGMTHEPGKRELYPAAARPAAAPDPRCLSGRVLCIDKTTRTLRWMVDGRTLTTVSVRFGSQYTPTREGVFHIYWKSRDHVSTLYHSPMPYAMFFSGGQAVHYSADFAARGYAGASHGCVNVRDETAIASLFAQVRNGDKVVVSW
ncbi:L,D-transpeptidase family protein [Streptomyces sp. NPDC002740]